VHRSRSSRLACVPVSLREPDAGWPAVRLRRILALLALLGSTPSFGGRKLHTARTSRATRGQRCERETRMATAPQRGGCLRTLVARHAAHRVISLRSNRGGTTAEAAGRDARDDERQCGWPSCAYRVICCYIRASGWNAIRAVVASALSGRAYRGGAPATRFHTSASASGSAERDGGQGPETGTAPPRGGTTTWTGPRSRSVGAELSGNGHGNSAQMDTARQPRRVIGTIY
jgi:hypothetical protein